MTTSAIVINILFILCLTSSVVSRSMGLVKADDKPSQKLWIPIVFGLSQGVMAVIGYNLGRLIAHLYTYIAEYMVFVMMLVVAIKLFVDAMRVLKGKMLYTLNSERDIILISILAAFNIFLMSLMGYYFLPFDWGFFIAVVVAGFLWAFLIERFDFTPEMIKKVSFIEFSASVFMVMIAVLYLFTDLI